VNGQDRGKAGANRAAKGRAMQDVERASATPEPDGIPERVPGNARHAPGAAEGEQLDVDPRSIAQSGQKPADDACSPGAGLHERRRVDPDSHGAAAPARSASRAVS